MVVRVAACFVAFVKSGAAVRIAVNVAARSAAVCWRVSSSDVARVAGGAERTLPARVTRVADIGAHSAASLAVGRGHRAAV